MSVMNPIIIVINNLRIGGAERLAVDQANELHRRGIAVMLVTFSIEDIGRTFMSSCELPESDRILIPIDSIYDLSGIFALARFLSVRRPRAIVTHLWFANTVGRIAALLAGLQSVIVFEHNVYEGLKTQKQFIVDYFLQLLSAHIIAVSEAVKKSLIANHISSSRISVIPNGIDLGRYRNPPHLDIRKELGIKSDFLYLFIGRLVRQKGVDILLDAFSMLQRGHLLIAGDGVERKALEEKAHVLGITSRVSFLGVRNDTPSLMKACNCAVFPSRWEGFGIVLIEALAVAIPVIVSDIPAFSAIVRDYESALVFHSDKPAALQEAMKEVYSNSALRTNLTREGATVAERFSIRHNVDILLTHII